MAQASNYVEALKKPRSVQITRSQLAESFFYLNGYPLSLADYPHMRLIHDISPKAMVLKFSRQCLHESQLINLAGGNQVLAKNLKAGDPVVGFNTDTLKNELTKISNVWDNGITHIYEIRTRTGRIAHVTDNHPFYMVRGWREASKLANGDLIAISRDNSCSLPITETVLNEHFIIAAYLLAEGSLTSGSIGFTNTRKECVDELQEALHKVDPKLTLKVVSPNAKQYQYRVNGHGPGKPHPLKPTLLKWGMLGKGSADKFHPDFVWNLTKKQLCHYLRIWWDTDGYVVKHKNGHYYPAIALISKQLTQGIQELLLKLGIHSTISVMQPPIYGGTNRYVYRVSVEGNESKQRFFNLIKTYKNPSNPVYKEFSSNQQLVIDASFIEEQLKTIKRKKQRSILYFNRNVNYYTLDKVKRILAVESLPELEKIVNSDIYFDKVEEVNYLGEHPSIAIEVEGTHTFQVNNLITKNTSKSSSLANIMAADAIMRSKNPHKGGSGGFQQMYVSPTVEQTKVFSHDRLTPVLDGSPWVKKNFMDPKLIQNVFMKQLKNGSKMYLRYALQSADRLRGFSVDKFYWDEVQDLHADIIPVAEQAMSRSYYKERIYAGTPKLTQGTLATLWYRSTMNEFLPKCEHCNKWNLLDEHNIGMKGLICKFCGGGLNPKNGQWVRTASKENDKYKMEGFRVCALHFYGAPWVNWKEDILLQYDTQPRNVFYNEILGLEYDQGSSPISEEDVKKCCTGGPMKQGPDLQTQAHRLFFGIDYGPMNSTDSYTVLLVMHQEGKKVRVVHAKKYMGKEADFAFIHKDIVEQFHRWHIVALGADHGLGEATNSELRSKLGQHKVIAFQHQANQKEEVRWNAKMKAYTLGRTPIMTRFFSDIKAGKFIFPQWDEWEPFAKDILAPVIDYDKDKIKMFYVNSRPDDTFHALIYGKTALDLVNTMVSW